MNCLKLGHIASLCYTNACECGIKKHRLLHDCEKNTQISSYLISSVNLSKAATVADINNDKVIVMADLGSGLSLISPSLVKRWQLKPIKVERINLRGIGYESYEANIFLVPINRKQYVFYEYPDLISINQDNYKNIIPKINGQIELLIENDNAELIKHDEYVNDNGKTLVKTKVGQFLYNGKREIPCMIMVKRIEDEKKISLDNEIATEKLREEIVLDNILNKK